MSAATSRFRAAPTALAVVTLGVLAACGSGGDGATGSTPALLDGAWEGTWSSSTADSSGPLMLQLNQAGTAVTGTGAFAGHPCVAGCEVAWEVQGEQIAGALRAGSVRMEVWGSCSGPHHGTGPHPGPHHAGEMNGSYQILGGACDGEWGTFQLASVSDGTTGVSERTVVGELILIDAREHDVVRLPLVHER